MAANDYQVGGNHYRKHGDAEQHWDRMWRLYGRGYFVGCATKYTERYPDKGGIQDLDKAIHFLQKLKELEEAATSGTGPQPGGGCRALPSIEPRATDSMEKTTTQSQPTVSGIEQIKELIQPSPLHIVHMIRAGYILCGASTKDVKWSNVWPKVTCPKCVWTQRIENQPIKRDLEKQADQISTLKTMGIPVVQGHGPFGALSCDTGDHQWEHSHVKNMMICVGCGKHKEDEKE